MNSDARSNLLRPDPAEDSARPAQESGQSAQELVGSESAEGGRSGGEEAQADAVARVGHTPKPWRADKFSIYGDIHIIGDHYGVIASLVCRGGGELVDENAANASLITAAPELLEALEMVRDADEDAKRDGLPRWCTDIARSRIDKAIEKATGKAVTQ